MPFPSKKRKSAAAVADDSDVEADNRTKRGKDATGSAFKPSSRPQTDADGNQFWEISKSRRVTLSEFKGKQLVNVREYYQKDNEWLPGKKGISMSLEQYSALVSILPQIEEALVAKGEKVPRPDYSGVSSEQQGQDLNDDDNEAELKSTKANIEATSDEED